MLQDESISKLINKKMRNLTERDSKRNLVIFTAFEFL